MDAINFSPLSATKLNNHSVDNPVGNFSSLNWKGLITSNISSSNFNLSYVPCANEKVVFSDAEVEDGSQKWNLCLVGYALERKPYYNNLLQILRIECERVNFS